MLKNILFSMLKTVELLNIFVDSLIKRISIYLKHYTVAFDQCNASLLNKSIKLLLTPKF